MKHKILIVDDEKDFTDMLGPILRRREGYEVMVENTSGNAIATAEKFGPDLILLDIVMPGADGGDVTIRLRQNERLKNVPVILVSALLSPKETIDGRGEAATDGVTILAKPVNVGVLVECIESKLFALQN